MADVPSLVGTFLAVGTLIVALLIAIYARRSLAAIALAVYLFTLGAIGMQAPVVRALGGDAALVTAMVWVLHAVSAAGILTFAVVYPNLNLTPRRRAALLTILLCTAGVIATMLLLPDGWWLDPRTGNRFLPRVFGPLFGLFGTVLPVAIMGTRWLRWRPGPFRTQLAWGMMPVAWWMLHDGLGYVVYPLVLGKISLTGPLLLGAAHLIIICGTLFTLAIVGIASSRLMRGLGAPDDRALGYVLLYILPFTLLQVVFPWSSGPPPVPPFAHILLDYAVVPLAVYGVLRHRIVDIDLKLKWGLKNSTVAGFFVAVFFVAATIAQEFLADSLGWLTGGAAAGLLILAIAPIQKAAERLSSTVFPNVRDDSGYLTYRRYQIYRVALEGILQDGVMDLSEASALRSLRTELGLTLDDHRALEGDARSRMAALGARGALLEQPR